MSDRTYCRLMLLGPQRAEDVSRVEKVSAENDGYAEGDGAWAFDEVNYANMPDDLRDALRGLSWAWAWDSGHEYGSGVEINDGRSSSEFSTNGLSLMIPLSKCRDESFIAAAESADALLRSPFSFM